EAEAESEEEFEAEPEPAPESEPEPQPEPDGEPLGDDFAEQAFQDRAARTIARAKDKKSNGEKVELLKAMSSHRARKARQTRSFVDSATKPEQQPEPQEDLDLAAFDTVDDRVGQTASRSTTERLAESAADRLRSVPPSDLSLVEMVERLAIALRNHHEAGRSISDPEQAKARDAALAESLNTLSKFTEKGYEGEAKQAVEPVEIDDPEAGETENEGQLRDAFAKLQVLRGAA
ncbi:MAG: hypothetical protein AAGE86_16250, partial [Pseudomonadota bacterium]